MLSRIPNESHIHVKSTTPGPGHYGDPLRISAEGNYILSTVPTSKVPTFKLPVKKTTERVSFYDYTKDNPAPNQYSPTKSSIMA